jgi:hypothetical protein
MDTFLVRAVLTGHDGSFNAIGKEVKAIGYDVSGDLPGWLIGIDKAHPFR